MNDECPKATSTPILSFIKSILAEGSVGSSNTAWVRIRVASKILNLNKKYLIFNGLMLKPEKRISESGLV